ncbi:Protein of unknown function [Maridesulfovibrio ferrireducens]|uniref:DUF3795 domain-containing protein n=1 Tax=Maridesulfovibrio ferrireducens TaxID=246191 RepID=A0A1G9H775_9BACT|nr:DUF3795 domain-containing protein [Maridesulfovibrio ferrireducens]SDL08742.1 Protein of unknown function [Maridesulfovibrio ferrireducens]
MKSKKNTACCGIYCPDCIHYKNKYSVYALLLKEHLIEINFDKYAKIKSPFGEQFQKYDEFEEVLNALAGTECNWACRVGGGCSGVPCKIMECCFSNEYEGCWDCPEVEGCDKFDFLAPRCGQMPKNNIRKIQKFGLQHWIEHRDNFYIWQK